MPSMPGPGALLRAPCAGQLGEQPVEQLDEPGDGGDGADDPYRLAVHVAAEVGLGGFEVGPSGGLFGDRGRLSTAFATR